MTIMGKLILGASAAFGLMLFTNTVVLVGEVNAYNHTCTYWNGVSTYKVDPWTTAPCLLVARMGGPYQ